jgi:hypothetical protein
MSNRTISASVKWVESDHRWQATVEVDGITDMSIRCDLESVALDEVNARLDVWRDAAEGREGGL